MEILASTSVVNTAVSSPVASSGQNAFGIGAANRPTVELSPQAQFLQSNAEQQQLYLDRAEQGKESRTETAAEKEATDDYIQVSSSVGNSARSGNLTHNEAMEIYRSIQNLL